MTIILDMEPPRCTAQHKGERIVAGRFVQHYEKAPQRRARLAYLAAIRKAVIGRRMPDYRTADTRGNPLPLRVRIDFNFKATRKRDIGAPKTTRPDADNMAKGLLDCLTQTGLIADDAQISALTVTKRYAARPSVSITITADSPQMTLDL